MTENEIIETAIQGHASTRDAIRWAIQQERKRLTVVQQPNCNRAVVVVDRGWIFAGDVTRENGRIKLTRALHVFKWENIGFAKMVKTADADLRPIPDVDIPEDSEIFCVPVGDSWGL
jgi:hypothetical protein